MTLGQALLAALFECYPDTGGSLAALSRQTRIPRPTLTAWRVGHRSPGHERAQALAAEHGLRILLDAERGWVLVHIPAQDADTAADAAWEMT